MNHEGFKQYVADHIKEFLPQDYSVHEIGITKQRKNNDVVLDALSIKGQQYCTCHLSGAILSGLYRWSQDG